MRLYWLTFSFFFSFTRCHCENKGETQIVPEKLYDCFTLNSLMVNFFRKDFCLYYLLPVVLQSNHEFSRWGLVLWTVTLTGSPSVGVNLWYNILYLFSLKTALNFSFACFFIEPIVALLFFVSHSALLVCVYGLSARAIIVPYCVRLWPYGTNCLVPQYFCVNDWRRCLIKAVYFG